MIIKSIFLGLAGSALFVSGVVNASTFSETADFGAFAPTDLGVLSAGINTISGSLMTSCVAASGTFADCSSGDESDSFSWQLLDGFELLDSSVTITNFTVTGTLASEQLGLGGIRAVSWESDGNYSLDLADSGLLGNFAIFQIFSSSRTSPDFFQGIGDIGYDYTLTLNVSASPVPLPAGAWLFGSSLLGIIGMRRKLPKKNRVRSFNATSKDGVN